MGSPKRMTRVLAVRDNPDFAYHAKDLVAPIRCGLKRVDWRSHTTAIRAAADCAGDDHAMARAIGVNRKQLLEYASEVPQFAAELYQCLSIAKIARKSGKTQSITYARRKVSKMRRYRERAEPLPLPRFWDKPPQEHSEPAPMTLEQIAEHLRSRGEGGDPTAADMQDSSSVPSEPDRMPDGMRSEDWEEYAIEIIRVGQGGGDDNSMAAALHVNRTAMLQYAEAVPDFNEAFMYAQTLARAWWATVNRRAMFKGSGINARAAWRGYDRIMKSDDQDLSLEPRCSSPKQA